MYTRRISLLRTTLSNQIKTHACSAVESGIDRSAVLLLGQYYRYTTA